MLHPDLSEKQLRRFKMLAGYYDDTFLSSHFHLSVSTVAKLRSKLETIQLYRRGISLRPSKLDEETAREIIRLRREGVHQQVLAEKYGVSKGTIHNIEKGHIGKFRHLVDE